MVQIIPTSKTEKEKTLAERCRIALEKNYGMPIPMPKTLAKSIDDLNEERKFNAKK
jgi:hypothetical protein